MTSLLTRFTRITNHKLPVIHKYFLLSLIVSIVLILSGCSVKKTTNQKLDVQTTETNSVSTENSSENETPTPTDNNSNTTTDETINSPITNEESLPDTEEAVKNDTTPTDSKDASNDDSASDTIVPKESYTASETTDNGYHDLIKDLHGISLSIETSDPKLDQAKTYLSSYDFNFTKHVIGQILAPDSLYVLCNKLNQLPKDYVPNDLRKVDVRFTFEGESEKKMLREDAATALESLFASAKEVGFDLFALSGYRSYNTQITNYTSRVDSQGQAAADKISARPGHSEHQTGLAMDVTSESANFKLVQSFGETPEGLWIQENAHNFGFIIRYQSNTTDITGYSYEPWHLRFITTDVATYLYENDITLEELYAFLLNK